MHQTWDKPRRPSPAIMLTGFFKGAKELGSYLLLILVATFFNTRGNAAQGSETKMVPWMLLSFLAGILIIVLNKFIEWFFTRYWVEGEKIVLTKGMLVKQRIELPMQKIQTIQLHQNMLHRLTGTSAVTMDTAGSENAEFEIEAIRSNDALNLQQWVRSSQHRQYPEVASDTTASTSLLSLGFADFVKLCISENHLKSLALISFFIMGKALDLSQQFGFDSKGFISTQSSEFSLNSFSAAVLLSIALVIAILFSSIKVMLKFYDYSLKQTEIAYEMGWGLFTRHRKIMPFAKVEFLSWWSNWLRQKMDLYVLRIHSLSESETEQGMHIQLPVTNRIMFAQISGSYITKMPANSGAKPAGIEKAFVYRKLLLVGLPLTLFVGTIGWFYAGWHTCWVVLWLVYFAVSQYIFYRNYRIWITNDAIQISRGIWGREQLVIYLNKIVSVALHTSPYQRSNGYANLVLHMPGKSWVIPYLTKEQADYWADYITLKMEA